MFLGYYNFFFHTQVEWGTLMFFAALFVLLEGLEQLGLVDWVGNRIFFNPFLFLSVLLRLSELIIY